MYDHSTVVNLIQNYRIKYLLLPFIGGVLYALGFPSKIVPHSLIFSMLGMYFLISCFELSYKKPTKEFFLKRQLLSLLLFSLGYCFCGYYWIPYTLTEFGQIPFPLNYLIGSSFSLIIIPQFLVFLLLHNIFTKFRFKSSALTKSIHLKTLLYAFALSFLEHIVPQQFPAHLGHTWLQLSPFLGLAPFVGVPVFSFFSYLLIFSFIAFNRTGVRDFGAVAAFLIFLVLNILLPLNPIFPETNQLTTNVRMVQANVGNYMKLKSEDGSDATVQEVFNRYASMSSKESKQKIDLIIWPETAYPKLQHSSKLRENLVAAPQIIEDVAKATGADLFIGGYDANDKSNSNFETEYNAVFHYDSQANFKDVYHKMKLIPFGESLPFGPFNKYISMIIDNIAYFARGEKFPVFTSQSGSRFIAAICYEIQFSNFVRTYLNNVSTQPHFLVNITNDSWYGDTAEPYQHLFLAKWQALVFNLPIVRMTNTGISSVIYPTGKESRRTKLFSQEILDVSLITADRTRTPYQKYGIFILILVWLVQVFFRNILLKFTTKNS